MRPLAALAASGVLAACPRPLPAVTPVPEPEPAELRVLDPYTLELPPLDSRPLAKLFLIGDSQIHYLYGKRGFAQAGWVDRDLVEVAIRPVHLDAASDLLLDAFLRFHRERLVDHALVHLGDFADLSCEQELDRTLAVFAARGFKTSLGPGAPWMFVPGNHDGFYVGNYTAPDDLGGVLRHTDMPHDWVRACSEPGSTSGRPLTKGRFVARMTPILEPQLRPAEIGLSLRGREDFSSYRTDHLYYARRLDPQGQVVLYGLFFDTSDYRGSNLSETDGAGTVGGVSDEQIAFFDAVIDKHRLELGEAPRFYALFGHHPYESFPAAAQQRWRDFVDRHRGVVVAYFAGHEHASRGAAIRLDDGTAVPEIVTGSTIDWPPEGRVVVFSHSAREKRVVVETQVVGFDLNRCRDVPRLDDGPLGYMAYKAVRDSDDARPGAWEALKLWVNEKMGSFEARTARVANALEIENVMVRQLAAEFLALDAARPSLTEEERAALHRIADRPFALGQNRAEASIAASAVRLDALSAYDKWFDPVMIPVIALRAQMAHRFAAYKALFDGLERLRAAPEHRTFVLCQALAASEQEAVHRERRGGVFRIR